MNPWQAYTERYSRGEWRAPIFRDMVLEDVRAFGRPPTVLDIGCGGGFDGELTFQKEIAAEAGCYIGIEPDPEIRLGAHVTAAHRCFFEDAPLRPGSVDVAFAVMVLEHLPEPRKFWDRLHSVLADGGVFWGFTVDVRHWFCTASVWMERLRVKEVYLNLLKGKRGVDRYHNYPVHYRANSPEQVLPLVEGFAGREFISFARVGQLNYYLPRLLQPIGRLMDRRAVAVGKPGMLLAMRLTKGALKEAGRGGLNGSRGHVQV